MQKTLTKNDLIVKLAKSLDLSESTAESGINQIMNLIIENLTAYKKIKLTGFGAPITIKQKPKVSPEVQDPGISEPVKPEEELSMVPELSVSGHEKRKFKRRNFILNIEIIDSNTNQIIGDLADITTKGVMIVSDDPVQENKILPFLIRLPKEANEKLEIVFTAKSIRCQKTIHENIFITGFKIENILEENRQKIAYLINEYAV